MTQICATLSTHPDALARLQSLTKHVDVAAVIIKPGSDGTFNAGPTALISAAQAAGAAALIWADVDQVAALGADGVHLPWGEDVLARMKHARAVLGNEASVGVDAGSSRHDAMELGEAGADYVAFSGSDGEDNTEARAALVAWWAELFEPPVVALGVSEAADALAMKAAGADFVSLDLDVLDSGGVQALVAALEAGPQAVPAIEGGRI